MFSAACVSTAKCGRGTCGLQPALTASHLGGRQRMSSSVRRSIAFFVSTVAAAACSGKDGGGAIVTEPVRHIDTALTAVDDDLAAAAPGYVKSLDGELGLGLSDEDEYDVVSVAAGRDGLR